MRITLDGNEVIIPAGGYEDKDDCLCRGCGADIGPFGGHTIVDCLRTLREAIIELQKRSSVEVKVKLYDREDIETMNKPETEEGK